MIMANSSKGVPNRNIGARLYAATLVERANFDELVFSWIAVAVSTIRSTRNSRRSSGLSLQSTTRMSN